MDRSVILYAAVSLDGYLADAEGGVDWLHGEQPEQDSDYGYDTFIKSVDTVIMGRRTYDQIVTDLSPDKWFYHGLTTYVLTHRPADFLPACFKDEGSWKKEMVYTSEGVAQLLSRLKKKEGPGIWVCGGADIAAQLMKTGLIDEFHLSVMPVLLGQGIRLFRNECAYPAETGGEGDIHGFPLHLDHTEIFNGVISCVYKRRF